MPSRLSVVWLVALALAVGCRKSERASGENEREGISASTVAVNLHDPGACASCHPAVVAEYQQSMHARSHHEQDPIYRGVRALRMKKEGATIAKACERCHTPDSKAPASSGVTCFTCHNQHAKAKPGELLASHRVATGATTAHGTGGPAPMVSDGRTLCLVCHQELSSPKGVAMCTTGIEHFAGTPPPAKSCASCHMPRAAGPGTIGGSRADHASHVFAGPHRAWYQSDPSFFATGLRLTADLRPVGLAVSLANESGHGFPTGFPGRVATLGCRGFDARGAAVWECKPVRFGKLYVDAGGKPTLAPFAAKLASDTRLMNRAIDVRNFKPPKKVRKVEVFVSMRLLPAKLAAKLGLQSAPEATPKVILTVTAER